METTQAASSPAEVVDPFNGGNPTMDEYNHYVATKELPDRFKPAEEQTESAPVDAPEETVEESEPEEGESEPASELDEEVQEQPQKGSGAEKRIKQLLAKVKELEGRLPKQDVKTEPSPVAQPQTAQQYTRPKPTLEDRKADGTPKFPQYEDFIDELSRWNGEQLLAQYKREQIERQALSALQTKLDDARTRYDDADEVIFPAALAIRDANIPQAVKQVIADSDLFADLVYVIGGDEKELKSFISLAQSNPRKALEKVFDYERGVREELSKTDEPSGKTPEPKKTSAPKPPSAVGGTSRGTFDVNDENTPIDEWLRKRNAQIDKRK